MTTNIRVSTQLAVLLCLVFISLLLGCSESRTPVSANHKVYAQLREQAADHWRDMAVEVADRVLLAVEDRCDIQGRPIHIAPPNDRPFTVAFYNLLRTELVSRGMQVSYEREPGAVVIEYSVQTVRFDPVRYTARGNPSEHEIIVNARMFFQNRFVMHCSSIRYINDEDWRLYLDPQVADPMAESSRNVRISNK